MVFGYSPVPHKLKGKLLPGLDGEIKDRFCSGWHTMVWSMRNGEDEVGGPCIYACELFEMHPFLVPLMCWAGHIKLFYEYIE